MSDEDKDGIYRVQTVPPPEGESDVYNAPTKVGPMASAVIQELIEQAQRSGGVAEAPKAPPLAEARKAPAKPILPPPTPQSIAQTTPKKIALPRPNAVKAAPAPAPARRPSLEERLPVINDNDHDSEPPARITPQPVHLVSGTSSGKAPSAPPGQEEPLAKLDSERLAALVSEEAASLSEADRAPSFAPRPITPPPAPPSSPAEAAGASPVPLPAPAPLPVVADRPEPTSVAPVPTPAPADEAAFAQAMGRRSQTRLIVLLIVLAALIAAVFAVMKR